MRANKLDHSRWQPLEVSVEAEWSSAEYCKIYQRCYRAIPQHGGDHVMRARSPLRTPAGAPAACTAPIVRGLGSVFGLVSRRLRDLAATGPASAICRSSSSTASACCVEGSRWPTPCRFVARSSARPPGQAAPTGQSQRRMPRPSATSSPGTNDKVDTTPLREAVP